VIASGIQRSPLFRQLADRLEGSDIIAHVVSDLHPAQQVIGYTTFVIRAGGVRYIRISVDPRLADWDLVATIGHELQHAVEIANARGVVDQHTMRTFYVSVGIRGGCDRGETFETATAVAVGQRIRREVR